MLLDSVYELIDVITDSRLCEVVSSEQIETTFREASEVCRMFSHTLLPTDVFLKPHMDEPQDSPYCEEHCLAVSVMIQDEDLVYHVKDPPDQQVYCMKDPPDRHLHSVNDLLEHQNFTSENSQSPDVEQLTYCMKDPLDQQDSSLQPSMLHRIAVCVKDPPNKVWRDVKTHPPDVVIYSGFIDENCNSGLTTPVPWISQMNNGTKIFYDLKSHPPDVEPRKSAGYKHCNSGLTIQVPRNKSKDYSIMI